MISLRSLTALTLLAGSFIAMSPAHAGINTQSGTTGTETAAVPEFTSEDLAALNKLYAENQAQLKLKQTLADEMKAKILAGDKTITSAQYNLLLQEIADLKEQATDLLVYIAQAKADIPKDPDTGSDDSGSADTSFPDAVKMAILSGIAQNLFGTSSNGLSGLNNMNDLLTGNINTGTFSGDTQPMPVDETTKVTPTEPVGQSNNYENCRAADYGVKDPTSQGSETSAECGTQTPAADTTCPNKLAEAMNKLGSCIWGSNSSVGNKCECASLGKEVAGLGRASTWKQGNAASCSMPKGTAVATMSGGGYCKAGVRGGQHGCHVAVFMGCNGSGQATMMDQYTKIGKSQITTWSQGKLAKYSIIDSGKQNGDGSRVCGTAYVPLPTLWDVFKLAASSLNLPVKNHKLNS